MTSHWFSMFGWFRPRCPVDLMAKAWIEGRLHWLSDQFGRETFTCRPTLLPTAEFFPDPVDGSEASVRRLLNRICEYMEVDHRTVLLELFTNKNDLWLVNEGGQYLPSGAAGLYEEHYGYTVIHIATSELRNISGLIGTIAHELAHLKLLGENRIGGYEFDNELLTDLTAVFYGFGIFLGNSPRSWDSQYSKWPGSELRCPEYMTLPMFAYALAHQAWCRHEQNPSWIRHLSAELRPNFRQGLRYLQETGNSTFLPD